MVDGLKVAITPLCEMHDMHATNKDRATDMYKRANMTSSVAFFGAPAPRAPMRSFVKESKDTPTEAAKTPYSYVLSMMHRIWGNVALPL